MSKKVAELSPVAIAVLEVIKNSSAPMTLKEIKEIEPQANSAHLTALRSRGLVNAEQIEVVVQSKAKVLAYTLLNKTE